MGHSTSTTSHRRSTGRIDQGAIGDELQRPRPHTVSIHILNDDSLLHVFYLCRPFSLGEDDIVGTSLERWKSNGRWWYTLAHVCGRWRNIVLGSATYLSLSLLCTYGTPVSEMLARSPPLPLVVGYFRNDRELTTEDEEGIIFAFKQRDRVRCVRLSNAVTIMQKLFMVMDEEYPILEYLYISNRIEDKSAILRFPESFQTPHLRHLTLQGFALPIGSRLLSTALGLVTLHLVIVHPSTYFHPNTLLQWILLMPHLETLKIRFEFSIPNRDVERQLIHTPIIPPITLPNLHLFHFHGVSNYLEALVNRIIAPRLKMLNIDFFNQLSFSVPRLLQFMSAADNLRFNNAVLTFSDKFIGVGFNLPRETEEYAFCLFVECRHLDWQVSSTAQIFNSLGQIFSVVERLVLQHDVHTGSSEEHNGVDPTEWLKLLRPFNNMKTLRIRNELVKDLSRCLELEEFSLELLPELHVLEYFGSGDTRDAFTSFIHARQDAGRPVTLTRL